MDTNTSTIHPFEMTGLGKAPFRFLRMKTNLFISAGCLPKPGGSCDHCWTNIMYEYYIRSSDGKVSKVGSDCIKKLGSQGKASLSPSDSVLISAARDAKTLADRKANVAKKLAAKARAAAKADAAFAKLSDPAVRAKLTSQPHPVITGKTLLDYVQWMREHAGQSGLARAVKIVEANS